MLTALRLACAAVLFTAAGGLVTAVGVLACGMCRPQRTDDFARWEAEGADVWRPGLYEIGLGGTD